MNLVMPPSTGSSYTMSAESSPVCGRASGRFSTFTASAGRFGTTPWVSVTPVSGQTGGGVGVGLEEGEPAGGPVVGLA